MSSSRRDFLRSGAFAALGLSLPLAGRSNLLRDFTAFKSLPSFGIQLWTVKEDMGKNAKDTLQKLSTYGYKLIESFEGQKGMFWGWKNTEFKKYMDDLGMKIVSSHCDNTKDFERKAAEAAEIGMKYLICAYKGLRNPLIISNSLQTSSTSAVRSVKRMACVLHTITTTIHSSP